MISNSIKVSCCLPALFTCLHCIEKHFHNNRFIKFNLRKRLNFNYPKEEVDATKDLSCVSSAIETDSVCIS